MPQARSRPSTTNTFDAPWKAALECYLDPFLRMCFPRVHQLVDWRVPPVFLEKELQQLSSDLPRGHVTADKLVKVRLRNGRDQYLFIHIEVQSQRDEDFAHRMWIYHYRVYDRVKKSLISLAVLADASRGWKPCEFYEELAGCVRYFKFPIFKVISFKQPECVFERTANPFALVVAAQQVALRTMRNPERRLGQRLGLVKYLISRGLPRSEAVRILRLIRWLTRLPGDLELKFDQGLAKLEASSGMKTIETLLMPGEERALRKGRREGRQEGRQEGRGEGLRLAILDILEFRFQRVPIEVRTGLRAIQNLDTLREAQKLALSADDPSEFLRRLKTKL